MGGDPHGDRLKDLANVPELPVGAGRRAYQADLDARQLIADIHEVDPREIWGRLNRWGKENPARLLAAAVHLAAYADVDQVTTGAPPPWTVPMGGTGALHPDFNGRRRPLPTARTYGRKHDDEIVKLREAGLTHAEIALRVGVSMNKVATTCRENGLGLTVPDAAERDAEILRLTAEGLTDAEIAARLTCSTRTVARGRQRAAERAA